MTPLNTSAVPNDLPPTAPTEKASTVKTLIMEEIRTMAKDSRKFRGLVDTAKTTVKKQYYTKKLSQNNNRMANYLMVLERMEQQPNIKTPEV